MVHIIKNNNNKALVLDNLAKLSPGGNPIFSAMSCTIKHGSLTLIAGPSGSGKTTLLRILAGLEKPSNGSVYINGRIASSSNQIIIPPFERNIGFLFQDAALWPHMTGLEQLRFVLSQHIPPKESSIKAIHTVIDQVGLSIDLLDRYPHQLSRGQQQRIAIARAVIAGPRFLFLDEPFTGLDQDLRITLSQFIVQLRKENATTIILVSHDLIQAKIKSDTKLVYQGGSFILDKTP